MSQNEMGPVLLTVRGRRNADIEPARALHNETAGSDAGVAAARALGDLSHKVYLPCSAAGTRSAEQNELLFVDFWENPEGLQKFFSDPNVQKSGGALFASRDASVWMAARGGFSFHLQAPVDRKNRFLGTIRGVVKSPEEAIKAFAEVGKKNLRSSRARGHLSHEIFIKLGAPSDPVELFGLDLWCDVDGMQAHYKEQTGLGGLWAGAPTASIWEQPTGFWREW